MFRRLVATARSRGSGAKRPAIAAGVLCAAVAATAAGLVLSSGGGPAHPAAPVQPSRHATAPRSQAAPPRLIIPRTTTLATVRVGVPGYASPGRHSDGTVPASWFDRPSVLPVIGTRPGWVRVRLAQRPNGSTAWLRASYVKLTSTPYRIVISLKTLHLSLYDHGRLVFSAPAGVGTRDDPTPAGEYFVAFDEQPPSSGYGAFVMVTSAHSPAISDWDGSGDAVIGIHGPLGMDAAIGTAGARISHGCVRLHERALERLAKVPPGTPIDVTG